MIPTNVKLWLSSFAEAWNMLSNVQAPFGNEDDDSTDELILACFPLVGGVLGMLGAMVVWLFASLFAERLFASIAAGVVITAAWEFLYAGGNVSGLARLTRSLLENRGISVDDTTGGASSESTLFMVLFFLKAACVGALAYNARSSWLVLALALGYLVRSRLAAGNDDASGILPVEDASIAAKWTWGMAAVVALLAGFRYLPAALLALLAAWGLVELARKTTRSFGGASSEFVDAYGAAADLVLFLVGVLLLAGR